MVKEIKPYKNYKVRVNYGGKYSKNMILTGRQIIDKREEHTRAKKIMPIRYSRKNPYHQITVLSEVDTKNGIIKKNPVKNNSDKMEEEKCQKK